MQKKRVWNIIIEIDKLIKEVGLDKYDVNLLLPNVFDNRAYKNVVHNRPFYLSDYNPVNLKPFTVVERRYAYGEKPLQIHKNQEMSNSRILSKVSQFFDEEGYTIHKANSIRDLLIKRLQYLGCQKVDGITVSKGNSNIIFPKVLHFGK